MKSIAALRMCLETLKRNHTRDMKYAAYAGTVKARMIESTIAELGIRIDSLANLEAHVEQEHATYEEAD